jgi:hypothetical protein
LDGIMGSDSVSTNQSSYNSRHSAQPDPQGAGKDAQARPGPKQGRTGFQNGGTKKNGTGQSATGPIAPAADNAKTTAGILTLKPVPVLPPLPADPSIISLGTPENDANASGVGKPVVAAAKLQADSARLHAIDQWAAQHKDASPQELIAALRDGVEGLGKLTPSEQRHLMDTALKSGDPETAARESFAKLVNLDADSNLKRVVAEALIDHATDDLMHAVSPYRLANKPQDLVRNSLIALQGDPLTLGNILSAMSDTPESRDKTELFAYAVTTQPRRTDSLGIEWFDQVLAAVNSVPATAATDTIVNALYDETAPKHLTQSPALRDDFGFALARQAHPGGTDDQIKRDGNRYAGVIKGAGQELLFSDNPVKRAIALKVLREDPTVTAETFSPKALADRGGNPAQAKVIAEATAREFIASFERQHLLPDTGEDPAQRQRRIAGIMEGSGGQQLLLSADLPAASRSQALTVILANPNITAETFGGINGKDNPWLNAAIAAPIAQLYTLTDRTSAFLTIPQGTQDHYSVENFVGHALQLTPNFDANPAEAVLKKSANWPGLEQRLIMGLPISEGDVGTPAYDLFTKDPLYHNETNPQPVIDRLKKIAAQIDEVAVPKPPQVKTLHIPVFGAAGPVMAPLFCVRSGGTADKPEFTFVDNTGKRYDSIPDWVKGQEGLQGRIYYPPNGQFNVDANGLLRLAVMDTPSHAARDTVDTLATIGCYVGGAAAIVFSGPAGWVAAGVTAASGLWMGGRHVVSGVSAYRHGASLVSEEMIDHYVGAVAGLTGALALAGGAASHVVQFSRGTTAAMGAVGTVAMGTGFGQMGAELVRLGADWQQMTPEEQQTGVTRLLTDLVFAGAVLAQAEPSRAAPRLQPPITRQAPAGQSPEVVVPLRQAAASPDKPAYWAPPAQAAPPAHYPQVVPMGEPSSRPGAPAYYAVWPKDVESDVPNSPQKPTYQKNWNKGDTPSPAQAVELGGNESGNRPATPKPTDQRAAGLSEGGGDVHGSPATGVDPTGTLESKLRELDQARQDVENAQRLLAAAKGGPAEPGAIANLETALDRLGRLQKETSEPTPAPASTKPKLADEPAAASPLPGNGNPTAAHPTPASTPARVDPELQSAVSEVENRLIAMNSGQSPTLRARLSIEVDTALIKLGKLASEANNPAQVRQAITDVRALTKAMSAAETPARRAAISKDFQAALDRLIDLRTGRMPTVPTTPAPPATAPSAPDYFPRATTDRVTEATRKALGALEDDVTAHGDNVDPRNSRANANRDALLHQAAHDIAAHTRMVGRSRPDPALLNDLPSTTRVALDKLIADELASPTQTSAELGARIKDRLNELSGLDKRTKPENIPDPVAGAAHDINAYLAKVGRNSPEANALLKQLDSLPPAIKQHVLDRIGQNPPPPPRGGNGNSGNDGGNAPPAGGAPSGPAGAGGVPGTPAAGGSAVAPTQPTAGSTFVGPRHVDLGGPWSGWGPTPKSVFSIETPQPKPKPAQSTPTHAGMAGDPQNRILRVPTISNDPFYPSAYAEPTAHTDPTPAPDVEAAAPSKLTTTSINAAAPSAPVPGTAAPATLNYKLNGPVDLNPKETIPAVNGQPGYAGDDSWRSRGQTPSAAALPSELTEPSSSTPHGPQSYADDADGITPPRPKSGSPATNRPAPDPAQRAAGGSDGAGGSKGDGPKGGDGKTKLSGNKPVNQPDDKLIPIETAKNYRKPPAEKIRNDINPPSYLRPVTSDEPAVPAGKIDRDELDQRRTNVINAAKELLLKVEPNVPRPAGPNMAVDRALRAYEEAVKAVGNRADQDDLAAMKKIIADLERQADSFDFLADIANGDLDWADELRSIMVDYGARPKLRLVPEPVEAPAKPVKDEYPFEHADISFDPKDWNLPDPLQRGKQLDGAKAVVERNMVALRKQAASGQISESLLRTADRALEKYDELVNVYGQPLTPEQKHHETDSKRLKDEFYKLTSKK